MASGLPNSLQYSDQRGRTMIHLDYIFCAFTVGSTILIGKRLGKDWVVAGANSILICVIGLNTTQIGFIPANIFCLALYVYNVRDWLGVPRPLTTAALTTPNESSGPVSTVS